MNIRETGREFLIFEGLSAQDLVPVVVQDWKSKEVLILAYMNQLAFDKTIKSGKVHFYSRSRKKLWLKGETSGDYLELKEIRVNCEQNSLLVKVRKLGKGSCHVKNEKGISYSGCFFRKYQLSNNKQSGWLEIKPS